jgi:hypothetical protein
MSILSTDVLRPLSTAGLRKSASDLAVGYNTVNAALDALSFPLGRPGARFRSFDGRFAVGGASEGNTVDFYAWLRFNPAAGPGATAEKGKCELIALGSGTITAGATACDGVVLPDTFLWAKAVSWTLDTNGVSDLITDDFLGALPSSRGFGASSLHRRFCVPECCAADAIVFEFVDATYTGTVVGRAYT